MQWHIILQDEIEIFKLSYNYSDYYYVKIWYI